MRTGLFVLLSAVVATLFVTASQITDVNAAARSVSPMDRLSIEQPGSSGKWKGNDITVEYSYSKDQGQIDLSGTVRFANFFMGYSRLQDFHLGVIFVDENGRVLEETGLTTSRGSFDPVTFHRRVKLPQNAAYMAFSYQGIAIPSGMGGVTSFSFYPVR
jgi:hypothetical protein